LSGYDAVYFVRYTCFTLCYTRTKLPDVLLREASFLTPRLSEPKSFEFKKFSQRITNGYWDQLDMWHAQESNS